MFSLISLKVLALRLSQTHNSQQQQAATNLCSSVGPLASHLAVAPTPHKQPTNQIPPSSFSESFIYSGKGGDGVTILGEGYDIVTKEMCSVSDCKQLRKSSHAAFCSHSLCGHVKLILLIT
jgi:hypothetical protein